MWLSIAFLAVVIVCLAIGFVAGLVYQVRNIQSLLANMSAVQLRNLADCVMAERRSQNHV